MCPKISKNFIIFNKPYTQHFTRKCTRSLKTICLFINLFGFPSILVYLSAIYGDIWFTWLLFKIEVLLYDADSSDLWASNLYIFFSYLSVIQYEAFIYIMAKMSFLSITIASFFSLFLLPFSFTYILILISNSFVTYGHTQTCLFMEP